MRNPHFPLIILLALASLAAHAQYGPVGFVNCRDGIRGTTGGMGGKVVRVSTREDLQAYAGADAPYIIVVEGRLEGSGLTRQRDVIEVGSDKTILGVKGAELAGIGLNIQNRRNIIIRNLIIHHADPDGIAARGSHHIWIDHCEVYSQDEPKREDWDGLIDMTLGTSYVTVSYCYLHDHHKACLLNSGTMHFEDNGRERATYHHNVFRGLDQRCPRVGYGRAHVFCNNYDSIGSYAIGVHSRAHVRSAHNWFGQGVRRPFLQMYASSTADASCGFISDDGSFFASPLREEFKCQPTGTDFDPSLWYGSDFALDDTQTVAELYLGQTGPVEGLEREPILWPGNGAIDVPLDVKPTYSTTDPSGKATAYIGTTDAEEEMMETDLSDLSISLAPSTTYYWRVHTEAGISPTYRFTTAAERPNNPTPANGDTQAQLRMAACADSMTVPSTLRWHLAADARKYKIYMSRDSNTVGQNLLAETDTTCCDPGDLLYGATYYWRVDTERRDGTTVKGDTWAFSAPAAPIREGRTEAERLTRNAYVYLERQDGTWFSASNDTVTVGEAGPGCMSGVWQGDEGDYDISITYYDEASGQARMALYVNNRLADQWAGNRQDGMTTHHLPRKTHLRRGDQLRIDFHTQRKMRCRIDYITITH